MLIEEIPNEEAEAVEYIKYNLGRINLGVANKVLEGYKILTAYKEGKELEFYTVATGYDKNWHLASDSEIQEYALKMPENFRVRNEPHLRPYENREEFLKASKAHGPHFRYHCEESDYYTEDAVKSDGVWFDDLLTKWNNFTEYVWEDGTPCGIPVYNYD